MITTNPTIEDRLRYTLREVAERQEVGPGTPLQLLLDPEAGPDPTRPEPPRRAGGGQARQLVAGVALVLVVGVGAAAAGLLPGRRSVVEAAAPTDTSFPDDSFPDPPPADGSADPLPDDPAVSSPPVVLPSAPDVDIVDPPAGYWNLASSGSSGDASGFPASGEISSGDIQVLGTVAAIRMVALDTVRTFTDGAHRLEVFAFLTSATVDDLRVLDGATTTRVERDGGQVPAVVTTDQGLIVLVWQEDDDLLVGLQADDLTLASLVELAPRVRVGPPDP